MNRNISPEHELFTQVLEVNEELNQIKDLDVMLDAILGRAREFCRADAGSIFLIRNGCLRFSYVHNDTLFREDRRALHKAVYSGFDMPINDKSIAGYAALTGETLVIDDVYTIGDDVPYTFNQSFDRSSGYRTQSVVAVPLKTSRDKVVGVLQLINALDKQGRVAPFGELGRLYSVYFGHSAASAIERTQMTREIILRMIRMAELRDPKETGAHVNRVAAYAAEIYQRWARKRGVESDEIKRLKSLLRLAAMLHDVGKVAVSDLILKKPGRLDEQEYAKMKYHTVHGATLFLDAKSDLDIMAREIALTHHERWDGEGYPGLCDVGLGEDSPIGPPGINGEDIPIWGRITALADVYDALCSTRVYKPPWPEEKVLATLMKERGRQFDPELIDVFFEIYDVILAIREAFKE